MNKQITIHQIETSVSSITLVLLIGILAELTGVGTNNREAFASSQAGVTCSAGLSTSSPDYAACRSAGDQLKAFGVQPVLICVDASGNDLGCKPINTDDMQLVLSTLQDMSGAMGLAAGGPQAFKELLKLGPDQYIALQNRSYNGYSGFTNQPWDFFAIDFDLLHGMLQGPGQVEAWIKNTVAHEMYHVIDGRYDFAYTRPMHTMGYHDTTPQQEDMSNPKPEAGLPVSDHGAGGPYDDWAEAAAAEMYAGALEAVYVLNYTAHEEGSMRSNYVEDIWHNQGRPQVEGKVLMRQLPETFVDVQAPSSQAAISNTENLPVYPGAQNVAVSNAEPNRLNRLYFETTDPLNAVYAYYERALQAAGWTEAPAATGHPRLLFIFPSQGAERPWNVDLLVMGEALSGGRSGISLFTLRWPDTDKPVELPGAAEIQTTHGVAPGTRISTLTLTVTQVTTLTVAEVETYLRGKLPEYGWVLGDNSSFTALHGLIAYFARVRDDNVRGGKVTVTAHAISGNRTRVTLVIEAGESPAPNFGSSPTGAAGPATSVTPRTPATSAMPGMPRSGTRTEGRDTIAYLLAALMVIVAGMVIRARSTRSPH